MRILFSAGVLCVCSSFRGLGQDVAESVEPTETRSAPAIVERGPHHRVWETTTMITDEKGGVTTETNSFTELATGMHYWNGVWNNSVAEFEISPDGAIARKGAHHLTLTPNANNVGAVDLLMPDGQRMLSHVIGLSLYDAASGKSILLSGLKDSVGELHPPNVVVYPDAFTDIKADLRYTYSLAGLEQDVVLRERPPTPDLFGFDPRTTRLEVVTEFDQAPQPKEDAIFIKGETDPQLRQLMAEPDFIDYALDFGPMQIGLGQAFVLDAGLAPDMRENFIPVAKRWDVIDGRNILFEAVELADIQEALAKLPAREVANLTSPATMKYVASNHRVLPRSATAQHSSKGLLVAQSPFAGKGLVLDYILAGSSANFTFLGDTTYIVSGTVNLSGLTTLEGGTVVKFTNYNANPSLFPRVNVAGTFNCKTSAYQPAVFTAQDDNSIGETLPWSTGIPLNDYAERALLFYNNGASITLENVRISYAVLGVSFYYSSGHVLRHAQIFRCRWPVEVYYSDTNLQNVLAQKPLEALVGHHATIIGQNLTINDAGSLTFNDASTFFLTNSLLVAVTNIGTYTGSFNHTVTDPSGVFQTVGAGNHYLASNSPHRNAGTANITAQLLKDLKRKTTYPPTVLTSAFAVNTTLGPQAPRDAAINPDLGFHYDPLDWAWSTLNLNSSVVLLLTNGVAVGIYGTKGTTLLNGAKFISEGAPTTLNRLVRYQAVQEQPIVWGTTGTTMSLLDLNASSPPEVRLRFTDISLLADAYLKRYLLRNNGSPVNPLAMTDCQLRGIYADLYATASSGMSIALTNNLVQRAYLNFYQSSISGYFPYTLNLYNNLVLGGYLALDDNSSATVWTVKDNLFDGVALGAGTINTVNGFNGYTTTTTGPVPLPGSSNHKLGIVPDYLSGPATNFYGVLGIYYYPTSGGQLSQLLDAGSRSPAAATLYHYSVKTAVNTKEGTDAIQTVDIGYHYIGVDSNKQPKDTDGDGVPDYIEDRNGNGIYEPSLGESNPASTVLDEDILVNSPAQDEGNDQNTQSETSTLIFGNTVVIAYVDSNSGTPGYGLDPGVLGCDNDCPPPTSSPVQFIGWAVSTDGGVTFSDKGNQLQAGTGLNGNAGDPVLARDPSNGANGMIYLIGNPQRPGLYAPLWKSSDNGQIFAPSVNAAPNVASTSPSDYLDKPWVTVDNFSGAQSPHPVYAVIGSRTFGAGSLDKLYLTRSMNGGVSFTKQKEFGRVTATAQLNSVWVGVGPAHEVYAFWMEGSPVSLYMSKSTDTAVNFSNASLVMTFQNPGAMQSELTRTKAPPGDPTDKFRAVIFPSFGIDPTTSSVDPNQTRIYFVYHDQNQTDNADIFFGRSSNGGASWITGTPVSDLAGSGTDQWQPRLVVKPDGSRVFVTWYDRREDLLNNSIIRVYADIGVKQPDGTISFGTDFPISSTVFPPAFTGTTMVNPGQYDPAYGPATNDWRCCQNFLGTFKGHMGDYDEVAADASNIYVVWGDNRRTTLTSALPRKQADVRIRKRAW